MNRSRQPPRSARASAPHPGRSRLAAALLLAAAVALVPAAGARAATEVCDGLALVSLSGPSTVTEGDTGSTGAVFVVRLSPVGQVFTPDGCDVEVSYATRTDLGSATAGADFTPTVGTTQVSDQQPEASIVVPVLGDTEVEGDEDFSLTVTFSIDGNISPATVSETAGATIVDDDEEDPTDPTDPTDPGDPGDPTDPETPRPNPPPPAPPELLVVGEPSLEAVVGQVVPLAVRVQRPDGTPVAGEGVEWSLTTGEGVFSPQGEASPTTTGVSGEDGLVRQDLRLTGRPGAVRVLASLSSGGRSVGIDIVTEGDLGDLFPERPSGPASVADALDRVCRRETSPAGEPGGELGALCDYLFALPDGEQRAVVIAATPRQAAAMGNLAIHAGHNQVDTLQERLRQRRAAAQAAASSAANGALRPAVPSLDVELDALAVGGSSPLPQLRLADLRASLARYSDEEAYVAERVARAVESARAEAAAPRPDGPASARAQSGGVSAAPATEPSPDSAFEPASRTGLFLSGRYSSGDRYSTFDEPASRSTSSAPPSASIAWSAAAPSSASPPAGSTPTPPSTIAPVR